ncbi:hypothetical protein [Bordetella bronchialis]|uniref:Lipoprotein n=1 Tax=Bordetella bronchialis TaxID=463025 RepID=A0A193FX01_9BORD|nr:hypothetical protein [Bordetella bronchialis]ANN71554.1 hypothetical protein BAU08_09570 [Bordetella bronchialis]
MRSAVAGLVLLAITGCAAQKQLTRDEYLQATQRTYQGKSAEDVYHAAEKLFRLADGDDFTFAYTDNSMTASRRWSIYLVLTAAFGTDTWLIQTKELPDGVKVSAQVSTMAGSVLPMATTGGDFTATGSPTLAGGVPGTAIYDVFWARMNYLLGLSQRWMTCEEAEARRKSGVVWGVNDALCNSFNMKDDVPEELAGTIQKQKPSGTSQNANY